MNLIVYLAQLYFSKNLRSMSPLPCKLQSYCSNKNLEKIVLGPSDVTRAPAAPSWTYYSIVDLDACALEHQRPLTWASIGMLWMCKSMCVLSSLRQLLVVGSLPQQSQAWTTNRWQHRIRETLQGTYRVGRTSEKGRWWRTVHTL